MVQITGRISRHNPVCVDICVPIISVEKKKASGKKGSLRVSTFHLCYLHGKTSFVESSDSDIKKLVAHAFPEGTKKSQQSMLSASLKVKKVTSRLSDLVLRKLKLSYFIK